MAITEAFTGSAVTVGSTAISLVTGTTTAGANASGGAYQAVLDLSALTAADLYELRIVEKVLSGGAQLAVHIQRFQGPLAAPAVITPALTLLNGWDMTLRKVSGTDRAISWSVRKVA